MVTGREDPVPRLLAELRVCPESVGPKGEGDPVSQVGRVEEGKLVGWGGGRGLVCPLRAPPDTPQAAASITILLCSQWRPAMPPSTWLTGTVCE